MEDITTPREDMLALLRVAVWEDPHGRHMEFKAIEGDVTIRITSGPDAVDQDTQVDSMMGMIIELPEIVVSTLDMIQRDDHGPDCTCGEG